MYLLEGSPVVKYDDKMKIKVLKESYVKETEKVKQLEAQIIGYQERTTKLENALKETDSKYNTLLSDFNILKEKIELAKVN